MSPYGSQDVQIAFQLLRKLEQIMAPHFSNSSGYNAAPLSPLVNNVGRNTLSFQTQATSLRNENRTNCLGCRVSLQLNLSASPDTKAGVESKVSTYRERERSNSLPLSGRCEVCSTASWESWEQWRRWWWRKLVAHGLSDSVKKINNRAFPFHSFPENGGVGLCSGRRNPPSARRRDALCWLDEFTELGLQAPFILGENNDK